MRTYSLVFVLIALVVLAMFLIYVIRGPVDPLIATGLFVSFLACLAPTLFLLKPFESLEDTKRRRAAREAAYKELERKRREGSGDGPAKDGSPRDPGS